jgi:hypothetical protein
MSLHPTPPPVPQSAQFHCIQLLGTYFQPAKQENMKASCIPQFMKVVCSMKTVHKVRICKSKNYTPIILHVDVAASLLSWRKMPQYF